MENLQLIIVKYLPVTASRGGRIKLIDRRLNESVTLERDFETEAKPQAIKYLESKGFDIVGTGSFQDLGIETVIVCRPVDNQFKSLKS